MAVRATAESNVTSTLLHIYDHIFDISTQAVRRTALYVTSAKLNHPVSRG